MAEPVPMYTDSPARLAEKLKFQQSKLQDNVEPVQCVEIPP